MSFTLPNFLHWSTFNALRHEMGAPLIKNFGPVVSYREIDLPTIKKLREAGVDVDFEDIKTLADGTLAYKGYRVLVYIRDVMNYAGYESMPKYHLSYCSTLEGMYRRNRAKRYVVANREDGLFQVNMRDRNFEPQFVRLNVCQNCLERIGWQGFSRESAKTDRNSIVKKFSLKEFFSAYPQDLLSVIPDQKSDTAPINDYTNDWGDVSQRKKKACGYACGKCALQLSWRESRFLHVHHVNGQKNDNSDANLEVLCIGCHADEPMHGHMKGLHDYIEFVALYPRRSKSG